MPFISTQSNVPTITADMTDYVFVTAGSSGGAIHAD